MTTPVRLAPALCLFLAHLACAQANIGIPTSPKPASPAPVSTTRASKGSPDCRSESHINSEGVLEFTDCSGKKEREDRSKFDTPSSASASTAQLDLDAATRAKQQEALRAKYEYQAFSYAHAQRTFDFQYETGKIIFWVVLLIVFSGLGFSAVQFYVGLRHPLDKRTTNDNQSKDAQPPAAEDPGVSEFEASLQGIKLKSSVLGLLILAMSMVFFYLYLKFVYQISNISQ